MEKEAFFFGAKFLNKSNAERFITTYTSKDTLSASK